MFCYKCGNEIPDDSEFCQKCGTKLNQDFTETEITNKTASPEKSNVSGSTVVSRQALAPESPVRAHTSEETKSYPNKSAPAAKGSALTVDKMCTILTQRKAECKSVKSVSTSQDRKSVIVEATFTLFAVSENKIYSEPKVKYSFIGTVIISVILSFILTLIGGSFSLKEFLLRMGLVFILMGISNTVSVLTWKSNKKKVEPFISAALNRTFLSDDSKLRFGLIANPVGVLVGIILIMISSSMY